MWTEEIAEWISIEIHQQPPLPHYTITIHSYSSLNSNKGKLRKRENKKETLKEPTSSSGSRR